MTKSWTSEDLGVNLDDLDLDDMGDFFRAWTRCKKAKKALNQEWSTECLNRLGVDFEVFNWGNHLAVVHPAGNTIIDFWPSTGKWITRGTGRHGRGIRNLLRYMGIKYEEG